MRRSHLVSIALAVAFFVALAAMAPSVAIASPSWAITQLTHDANNHGIPQVSGDRVVWEATVGGSLFQIFTQEIGVDTQPSQLSSGTDHENPELSGSRAVWQGTGGSLPVFTEEIGVDTTPTQLTGNTLNNPFQEVSGNRVVWQAVVNGHRQIFTQKIGVDSQPVTLTVDPNDHSIPVVSGDRVVWTGEVGVDSEIFTQKIGTDSQPVTLTVDPHNHGQPAVSGDRVAWEGYDSAASQWKVFTWKAGDSEPTTLGPVEAGIPLAVSGDRVVWQTQLGGLSEIFTQKIGVDSQPVALTVASYNQYMGGVSGDRVVWYGSDGNNQQIFTQEMGVDSQPIAVTDRGEDNYSPEVDGNRIVWAGSDGANNQIFTAVPSSTTSSPTLTYKAGSGGSIDGSATQVVNYGSDGATVTAVPNSGYHFTGWSDGSLVNPRQDTNVKADATYTGTFAIDTYKLHYVAGAGGTLLGVTSQTVDWSSGGTPVTAVPAAGYHFVSWSDGLTTATRTDSNVTANMSVTANFAPNTGKSLTITQCPKRARHGYAFQMRGRVAPISSYIQITRYRWLHRRWVSYGRYNQVGRADGMWIANVSTNHKGSWKFIVRANGLSATRYVTAY